MPLIFEYLKHEVLNRHQVVFSQANFGDLVAFVQAKLFQKVIKLLDSSNI